jgi:Spy/CpxP family protein refolding chaperone
MENTMQEVKMKKILTMTIICSFMILSSAVSIAQPLQRSFGARRMFDNPQTRILGVLKANREELKITDQQMEQIQNLVFSFREKAITMRNERSLNRLELQKLMQKRENLDYDKIKAVLSKISASRQEIFIAGLKLRDEIKKVLTPEQREALKVITRNDMRNHMHDFRDSMQQRFPQPRDRIRR